MPYGNIGRMKSWGADGNMEFYQQIGKDAHVILRSNFTLSKNKILNWEDTKKPYTYLEIMVTPIMYNVDLLLWDCLKINKM